MKDIRQLLDHVPDGVFWSRLDGSFAYVNDAAATMLGHHPDRLVSLRVFDLDPALDRRDWERHWEGPEPGGAIRSERRLRRADGSEIPIEVHSCPIEDRGERYLLSFLRDLTERNRSTRFLEESADYLRALFVESPLPQLIIDPDAMCVVDANRAAETFYRYPELRGMSISDLNALPPARMREEMDRAVGAPGHFARLQQKLAGGELRTVHAYCGPIEHHGRTMLLCTVRDVSDTESALQQLCSYRDLVERLPIGIYRATLGGDGVFLAANPALCQIFGVASEDALIGRRVADFYAHPEQRAEYSDLVLRSGSATRDIFEARSEDGRTLWLARSSRVAHLEEHGTVLEGAVEDVTRLIEAEHELKSGYEHFAKAIDAAPYPILLHRRDGRIEYVNRAWTDLTGYSRSELRTIEDWTRLAYGNHQGDVLEDIHDLQQIVEPIEEGDDRVRC